MKLTAKQVGLIEQLTLVNIKTIFLDDPKGVGWFGLVYNDQGFQGTVGGSYGGYPFRNLSNLLDKVVKKYGWAGKHNGRLYVIRVEGLALWLETVLQSVSEMSPGGKR